MEAPQSLDLRREDFQSVEHGVIDHAHGHFPRPESVCEIQLHVQAVAGKEIRVILKCQHGLVRSQTALNAVIIALSQIHIPAVLNDKGLVEMHIIVDGSSDQGILRLLHIRNVNIVIVLLQLRQHLQQLCPCLGHLQTQLVKDVVPDEHHHEGCLLRQTVEAPLEGGRIQRALVEPLRHVPKTIQLGKLHHGVSHGEVLQRALSQTDNNVRAVSRQRGPQNHVHGNQLQVHGNARIGGKVLVNHVLYDLGLLLAVGGQPHLDPLGSPGLLRNLAFLYHKGGEEPYRSVPHSIKKSVRGRGQISLRRRQGQIVHLQRHVGHIHQPCTQRGHIALELVEFLRHALRIRCQPFRLSGHLLQKGGVLPLLSGDLHDLLHDQAQGFILLLHLGDEFGYVLDDLIVYESAGSLPGELHHLQVQTVQLPKALLHSGDDAAHRAHDVLQSDGVPACLQMEEVGRTRSVGYGIIVHPVLVAEAHRQHLLIGDDSVDIETAAACHAPVPVLPALEGQLVQPLLLHLHNPCDRVSGFGPVGRADGIVQNMVRMIGLQRAVGIVLLYVDG